MPKDPDELVALGTYPNEFSAGVIAAKLEEEDIPSHVIAANEALIGVWGLARWVPFTVWVRAADEEFARAVLETVRAEQGTVDWDAVDVGEPDPTDRAAQDIAAGRPRGALNHVRLGVAGALLIASVIALQLAATLALALLLAASILALPVLMGWLLKRAR